MGVLNNFSVKDSKIVCHFYYILILDSSECSNFFFVVQKHNYKNFARVTLRKKTLFSHSTVKLD